MFLRKRSKIASRKFVGQTLVSSWLSSIKGMVPRLTNYGRWRQTDTLKEDAEVVNKTQKMDLDIRDIKKTVTKKEIAVALKKAVCEGSEITAEAIKSLRRAYGETQIASVMFPTETARKIIGEESKIRIGWIRCRIKEVRRPIKCWHFGHISFRCKSEIDKCHEDGQKIAECTKDACYVLCNKGKEKLHFPEYWTKEKFLRTDVFSKIMSKDRYAFLLRNLYFSTIQLATSNRLTKIREFCNKLCSSFKNCFTPFQDLYIDESLLLYKGFLSFKKYIRFK